jgi:hypothetical protein
MRRGAFAWGTRRRRRRRRRRGGGISGTAVGVWRWNE